MTTQGNTTARGYGNDHQKLRAALLADLKARPGQPCARCGRPMYPEQQLHLDHTDDRAGYRGLAHALCNLKAGARKGNQRRRGRRQWRQTQLRTRW